MENSQRYLNEKETLVKEFKGVKDELVSQMNILESEIKGKD